MRFSLFRNQVVAALLLISITVGLTSCSSFFKASQKGDQPARPTQRTSPGSATLSDGIEIFWQMPSEPVDGYIVRYGYDKSKISNDIKLTMADLQAQQDPEFGKAFRYLITPVEAGRLVYVTIAAFKGNHTSEFSEIFEAGPLLAKKGGKVP